MKYFLVIGFFGLLFLQSQAQINNSLKVGYSISEYDYLSISKNIRKVNTELRFFVNDLNRYRPGFAFIPTFSFLAAEDYEFYAGLGFQFESFLLDDVLLPIGINLHPFENKKVGIQMEFTPSMVDIRDLYGSFGFRYALSSKPINERKFEIVEYNRAFYITAAGTAIGPGFQYSWLKKNLDYHFTITTIPMTVASAGMYYHFMAKERTKMTHPYIGADLGYVFNYVGPAVTAYIPFGLQTVYANRLTICYEFSAIYIEEEFYTWFGLKIGKAILR